MPHYDSSDDEPAPVFVFDETSYGIKKKAPSAATASAAKRSDSKIDLDTSAIVEAGKKANMDADDIADMEVTELWERLKNSVEDLAASALSGKDRKKYLLEKTARLSGHAVEKPKAPFRILKGMREAEKVRAKRAKEEARIADAVVVQKSGMIAVGTKSKKAKRSRR